MGNYNLNISGLGTHSPHVPEAQKDAGWAEVEARSLVVRLLAAGHQIGEAILTHWPGTEHEVKENLLTGEKVATNPASAAAPTSATVPVDFINHNATVSAAVGETHTATTDEPARAGQPASSAEPEPPVPQG